MMPFDTKNVNKKYVAPRNYTLQRKIGWEVNANHRKTFAFNFHIYRPPIPPYVRFLTRRFRAFSSHDAWQVAFSYPFEYLYCYLTTFLPDSTHPL